MSRNTDLSTLILAADRLNESGKLDRLMSIFDADPVLTGATADKRHRATASKAGKVITRNERASLVGKATGAVATIDESPLDFARRVNAGEFGKPAPVKPAPTPRKPVKAASKPVVKPVKADDKPTAPNYEGKLMLSGRGTASAGQKRWMKENGVKPNVISIISMVAASNLRAKMSGRI